MLKLRKVAVTGGLASGKTTVCRILKELGAHVISADEIVHRLLSPDTEIGQKVIQLIGPQIVVDGQIDRQRIANKAFNNPRMLRTLEELLHPAVYEQIEEEYEEVKKTDSTPLVVVELPLLFESGGDEFFDRTVCVTTNPETSWERFRRESGYAREEFARRMGRQMPPEEKAKRADIVIDNNGSLEQLRETVTNLFNNLTH